MEGMGAGVEEEGDDACRAGRASGIRVTVHIYNGAAVVGAVLEGNAGHNLGRGGARLGVGEEEGREEREDKEGKEDENIARPPNEFGV
jgi:hypothetical protein